MDFDYVVAPFIILALAILVIRLSVRRMRSLSTTAHRTQRFWRREREMTRWSEEEFGVRRAAPLAKMGTLEHSQAPTM